MNMDMDHHMGASGWEIAGALGLLGWTILMWAAVILLARAQRRSVRPWQFWTASGVVGLGVIGQFAHAGEHFAQVGYWVGHSQSAAWMTPWGSGLAKGYGDLVNSTMSKPALGMEILHLVGNTLFLAGLAGLMVLTRPLLKLTSRRWARMGVWMQGIHGLEHVSLTLSVALGAHRAIGLSTWFGILPPGPGLWTYRIWWHFVANVIGSAIFGVALTYAWKERHALAAAYGIDLSPATQKAPSTRPVTA